MLLVSRPVGPARAEDAGAFPQRVIRIVVPFAPGGGTDILARSIAQQMSLDWKQPVVVDNRPGSATVAGTELVVTAPADGYTLLFTANPFTVNPGLLKALPYDPRKDMTPVTRVAISPLLLVVNPSVPAKTLSDLIALARSKPGSLNYASSGIGGPEHLAGAMLASMSETKLVHVPFRGSGPAIVALLSGEVQMSFTSMISALAQVKAGKLRALAVSSATRSPVIPDVPTVAETQGLAGYEIVTWYGILAPAATPPAIVARLQGEIAHTLETPQIRARLAEAGALPAADTPAAFADFLAQDMARAQAIITKADIRAE
jgi:tripartite-type tricarboxylate transporter receptor subunit TctC